jgi:hypothetical protein
MVNVKRQKRCLTFLASNFAFLDSQKTSRFFMEGQCAYVACEDVDTKFRLKFVTFQNVSKIHLKIIEEYAPRAKTSLPSMTPLI